MNNITRKAAEWTVRPVHKQDGKEWPGLGYISDGNQTYGAVNIEQAKVIAAAHNSSIQSAIEEATKPYRESETKVCWLIEQTKITEPEGSVVGRVASLCDYVLRQSADTKRLIELLAECRTKLDWSVCDGEFLERIDAAMKEGK